MEKFDSSSKNQAWVSQTTVCLISLSVCAKELKTATEILERKCSLQALATAAERCQRSERPSGNGRTDHRGVSTRWDVSPPRQRMKHRRHRPRRGGPLATRRCVREAGHGTATWHVTPPTHTVQRHKRTEPERGPVVAGPECGVGATAQGHDNVLQLDRACHRERAACHQTGRF